MDSLDMDLCGDLFDHIDDLLDFPNQEDTIMLEDNILRGGDSNGFQGVWQQPPQDSLFSDHNTSSGFSTELPVPDEDIAQLEWLSTFVEDSFSPASLSLNDYLDGNSNKDSKTDNDNNNNNNNVDNNGSVPQFQIPSPVSVLESSSSCSGGRTMPVNPEAVVPSRARSKRPRPATFNPRLAMSLISPTSSITEPTPTFIPLISPTSSFTDPTHGSCSPELVSEFENFAESYQLTRHPELPDNEQKKKKKKRLTITSSASEQHLLPEAMPVRKCLHCEITKTPQWRAGPLGPKTLCNACGVRHKSGRLFPEYRPAASPTFVPKLHSNSHKKVLEMRGKTGMMKWP